MARRSNNLTAFAAAVHRVESLADQPGQARRLALQSARILWRSHLTEEAKASPEGQALYARFKPVQDDQDARVAVYGAEREARYNARIHQLHAEGQSVADLARATGRSQAKIKRILKETT